MTRPGDQGTKGPGDQGTRRPTALGMLQRVEPRVWRGAMPVQFLYTAGVAGERFFQTLKRKGVFTATHCAECRLTYLPPRIYCERCFADLSSTWREVASVGRVHTYTIVHVDREGLPLSPPEVIAFVRIEGTEGGLVTRLLKIAPTDVRIDMPVELVLAPQRRRRGTLDDILGFSPRR